MLRYGRKLIRIMIMEGACIDCSEEDASIDGFSAEALLADQDYDMN